MGHRTVSLTRGLLMLSSFCQITTSLFLQHRKPEDHEGGYSDSKSSFNVIRYPREPTPKIQIIEYGAPCECCQVLPYHVEVPRNPPKPKLYKYGYSVDVPHRPVKKEQRCLYDYQIQVPRKKPVVVGRSYDYKVEVPPKPKKQSKFYFNYELQIPNPKKYTYNYEVTRPKPPKREEPCKFYGYQLEIPHKKTKETRFTGLVAQVDKVLVPRKCDCKECENEGVIPTRSSYLKNGVYSDKYRTNDVTVDYHKDHSNKRRNSAYPTNIGPRYDDVVYSTVRHKGKKRRVKSRRSKRTVNHTNADTNNKNVDSLPNGGYSALSVDENRTGNSRSNSLRNNVYEFNNSVTGFLNSLDSYSEAQNTYDFSKFHNEMDDMTSPSVSYERSMSGRRGQIGCEHNKDILKETKDSHKHLLQLETQEQNNAFPYTSRNEETYAASDEDSGPYDDNYWFYQTGESHVGDNIFLGKDSNWKGSRGDEIYTSLSRHKNKASDEEQSLYEYPFADLYVENTSNEDSVEDAVDSEDVIDNKMFNMNRLKSEKDIDDTYVRSKRVGYFGNQYMKPINRQNDWYYTTENTLDEESGGVTEEDISIPPKSSTTDLSLRENISSISKENDIAFGRIGHEISKEIEDITDSLASNVYSGTNSDIYDAKSKNITKWSERSGITDHNIDKNSSLKENKTQSNSDLKEENFVAKRVETTGLGTNQYDEADYQDQDVSSEYSDTASSESHSSSEEWDSGETEEELSQELAFPVSNQEKGSTILDLQNNINYLTGEQLEEENNYVSKFGKDENGKDGGRTKRFEVKYNFDNTISKSPNNVYQGEQNSEHERNKPQYENELASQFSGSVYREGENNRKFPTEEIGNQFVRVPTYGNGFKSIQYPRTINGKITITIRPKQFYMLNENKVNNGLLLRSKQAGTDRLGAGRNREREFQIEDQGSLRQFSPYLGHNGQKLQFDGMPNDRSYSQISLDIRNNYDILQNYNNELLFKKYNNGGYQRGINDVQKYYNTLHTRGTAAGEKCDFLPDDSFEEIHSQPRSRNKIKKIKFYSLPFNKEKDTNLKELIYPLDYTNVDEFRSSIKPNFHHHNDFEDIIKPEELIREQNVALINNPIKVTNKMWETPFPCKGISTYLPDNRKERLRIKHVDDVYSSKEYENANNFVEANDHGVRSHLDYKGGDGNVDKEININRNKQNTFKSGEFKTNLGFSEQHNHRNDLEDETEEIVNRLSGIHEKYTPEDKALIGGGIKLEHNTGREAGRKHVKKPRYEMSELSNNSSDNLREKEYQRGLKLYEDAVQMKLEEAMSKLLEKYGIGEVDITSSARVNQDSKNEKTEKHMLHSLHDHKEYYVKNANDGDNNELLNKINLPYTIYSEESPPTHQNDGKFYFSNMNSEVKKYREKEPEEKQQSGQSHTTKNAIVKRTSTSPSGKAAKVALIREVHEVVQQAEDSNYGDLTKQRKPQAQKGTEGKSTVEEVSKADKIAPIKKKCKKHNKLDEQQNNSKLKTVITYESSIPTEKELITVHSPGYDHNTNPGDSEEQGLSNVFYKVLHPLDSVRNNEKIYREERSKIKGRNEHTNSPVHGYENDIFPILYESNVPNIRLKDIIYEEDEHFKNHKNRNHNAQNAIEHIHFSDDINNVEDQQFTKTNQYPHYSNVKDFETAPQEYKAVVTHVLQDSTDEKRRPYPYNKMKYEGDIAYTCDDIHRLLGCDKHPNNFILRDVHEPQDDTNSQPIYNQKEIVLNLHPYSKELLGSRKEGVKSTILKTISDLQSNKIGYLSNQDGEVAIRHKLKDDFGFHTKAEEAKQYDTNYSSSERDRNKSWLFHKHLDTSNENRRLVGSSKDEHPKPPDHRRKQEKGPTYVSTDIHEKVLKNCDKIKHSPNFKDDNVHRKDIEQRALKFKFVTRSFPEEYSTTKESNGLYHITPNEHSQNTQRSTNKYGHYDQHQSDEVNFHQVQSNPHRSYENYFVEDADSEEIQNAKPETQIQRPPKH